MLGGGGIDIDDDDLEAELLALQGESGAAGPKKKSSKIGNLRVVLFQLNMQQISENI